MEFYGNIGGTIIENGLFQKRADNGTCDWGIEVNTSTNFIGKIFGFFELGPVALFCGNYIGELRGITNNSVGSNNYSLIVMQPYYCYINANISVSSTKGYPIGGWTYYSLLGNLNNINCYKYGYDIYSAQKSISANGNPNDLCSISIPKLTVTGVTGGCGYGVSGIVEFDIFFSTQGSSGLSADSLVGKATFTLYFNRRYNLSGASAYCSTVSYEYHSLLPGTFYITSMSASASWNVDMDEIDVTITASAYPTYLFLYSKATVKAVGVPMVPKLEWA